MNERNVTSVPSVIWPLTTMPCANGQHEAASDRSEEQIAGKKLDQVRIERTCSR